MGQPGRTIELRAPELKGSRLRCLMLTSGSRAQVADRLDRLVRPVASVTAANLVMPAGFLHPAEAKLGESPGFLSDAHRESVSAWWLKVRRRANTPNWDIVANCQVRGRDGLLLVEAKAHEAELGTGGKPFKVGVTNGENHARIGDAIREANDALPGGGWALSRDSHYQLSNRFAWAWKVASLGVPIVLVYLGFLNADEMGRPFRSPATWEAAVRNAAAGRIPGNVWETGIDVGGTPLVPLIRSVDIRFETTAA